MDNSSTVSVSSLPTITIANAGPSAISHTMLCRNSVMSGSKFTYYNCDASDNTQLVASTMTSCSQGCNMPSSITHDAAFAAGWKLVGPGCSSGASGLYCYLFHK